MKNSLLLTAILICLAAGAAGSDRSIAITNLVSGSIAPVGQNMEINIRTLESATEVFVLGPCLDQAGGRAEKVGSGLWVWRGKIVNSFSALRTCPITATDRRKRWQGNNKSETVFLLPDRRDRVLFLKQDLTEFEMYPCNEESLPIYGYTASDEVEVSFDKDLHVDPEHPEVVQYLGNRRWLPKKPGVTKVLIRHDQAESSLEMTVRVVEDMRVCEAKASDPQPTSTIAAPQAIATTGEVAGNSNSASAATPSVKPTVSATVPPPSDSTPGFASDAASVSSVGSQLPTPVPVRIAPSGQAAKSGSLVWSGQVDKDGLIRIEGAVPTIGTMTGDPLPLGKPIQVSIEPKDFAVAQAPSASNQFNRVVIRSPRKGTFKIVIHWQVVE